MTSNSDSFSDMVGSFTLESQKLQEIIDETEKKSENLSIPEIIGNYFQIINVNSHITLLKKQLEITPDQKLSEKIKEIEMLISEKFNKNLHPFLLSQITKSVEESMANLQSNQTVDTSKEDIENNAKLYDALREKMSTKEFVEQYDKGLAHD